MVLVIVQDVVTNLRGKAHILAKLEARFLDGMWLPGQHGRRLAAVRNQRRVAIKSFALVQVHTFQVVKHVHDLALDNVLDRGTHQFGHGVVPDAKQTHHRARKEEIATENQLFAVDERRHRT